MKFYIEIDNPQRKFSTKNSGKSSIVIYQQNVFDYIVDNTEHKDRIYNNSIDKCADLDCTKFYSSAFVSGSVSQCGDCTPRTVPPRITNPTQRCSVEVIMETVIPQTEQYVIDGFVRCDNAFVATNLGIKVINSDDVASYNAYLNWLATNPQHVVASRNGFWLGLPICGPQYQCLVSCSGGSVAGCWNVSGGTGTFGDIYSIAGQDYQVYDPIQIHLAGLRPNGGSFPLLSTNPLSGRTSSGTNCGTPITQTSGQNCLSSSGSSEYCTVPSNIGPSAHLNNNIGFQGDFSGKSFMFTGGSCGFVGSNIQTTRFALGGSNNSNLQIKTFQEAGITGVYDSCGDCTSSSSKNGNGPDCCQVSYGNITINGAPTWTGSGWTAGGEIWNNFWNNNDRDNNFRVNEQTGSCSSIDTCWGTWRSSCGSPALGSSANSFGSIKCTPAPPISSGSCPDGNSESKLVSFWRVFELKPQGDDCISELKEVVPGIVTECEGCSTLDDCIEIYDTLTGSCVDIPVTHPSQIRHAISRNLYPVGIGGNSENNQDTNRNGNGCFNPMIYVSGGIGLGYLRCSSDGDEFGQKCCSSSSAIVSDTQPPAEGDGPGGRTRPFIPSGCNSWFYSS